MAEDKKKLEFADFDAAQVEHARAEDYRTMYVNSTRLGLSPWDVRFTLGQVVEISGKQVNEDMVTVVMSPQQGKAFLAGLQATIRMYEETFGEIPEVRPQKPAAPPLKAKLKRTS